MKRCLVAVFILAVALGGFASGAPSPDQSQPSTQAVSGTVISTGSISFAIRADDDSAKSFLLLTSTSLPSGGFRPGDRVSVDYQSVDADHAAATKIGLEGSSDAGALALASSASAPSGTPTIAEASDSSDAWRGLLFIGLLATVFALALTTLVGLLRSQGAGRPHTSA